MYLRLKEVHAALGLCLAFLLAAGTAQAQALANPNAPATPIGDMLQLADFTVQQLSLPPANPQQLAVHVTIDGVDRVLHLRQHSLRSDDFELLVDEGNGLVAVEPPAPRTYRGFVLGVGDSRVAASLSDGELTASIYVNSGEAWYVEPLAGVVSDAGPADHLVYRGSDVLPDYDHRCGTDDLRHQVGLPDDDGGHGERTTGLEICEIGLEADYPFYQKFYSLAATMHDMEGIYNDVETVYERDTDITYEVTTIVVRTSSASDPYTTTNPEVLLTQMRSEWTSNLSGIRRDVAQLFTGRNLSGSVIGIAWVGSVCNFTYGYSLCQSKYSGSSWRRRVALHAHELGHSWNARHCDGYSDCHIMCSYINGCNGIGAPEFGWKAQGEIVSYRNGQGAWCLEELDDPITPPFYDQFAGTALRTDLWSYNDGGVINANAVGEPSGPYSLNLDSTGSRPYGDDDDIRTNFILLGGYSGANLSYYTQHRGVESGEKLYVEYWNDDLTWVEINEITSDGSDQSSFTHHEHTLPGDAYHNEFRVRFRVDGNQGNDEWYLDDVAVSEGDPPPPEVEHTLVEVPITDEAKVDDPTLEHAQTFDLVVTMPDDDWTSSKGTATIDGTFYQHPTLDGDVPQTAIWGIFPALEFDSFWSAPNFVAPSFVGGETIKQDDLLQALWFDTTVTEPGSYTIARYTMTAGTLLHVYGETTLYSTGGYLWAFDVSADVNIPSGCVGDLDGDGDTDHSDLGILLADWGCTGGDCPGDLDGDGDTDHPDLGILLADWGCVP